MPTFQATASTFQQGSRAMPREYFTAPEIFGAECNTIFARHWSCAGRAGHIPRPGDYVLRDIAGESLIVVRGRDFVVRAFVNVCRHRGTRLCSAREGACGDTIRCPYHAWTYTTEGRLIGAPHMQDVEGFDKDDFPLHAASVAESDGFLFVHLGPRPQPFVDWFNPMRARLDRFGLAALEGRHRMEYDVHANWKLVFQNYSECLHCPVIHPELAAVLPYQSSANDLVEGPFLGGFMEISPPYESVTRSGRACGTRISESLDVDDHRRAYYYSVIPNLLLSIHPDYVNYYVLTPCAPDRTRVESEWLFGQASERDSRFNPADAIAFWDTVNRQDWDIVERGQLGIASRRYTPGPYSPRESLPAAWDREYLRLMQRSG